MRRLFGGVRSSGSTQSLDSLSEAHEMESALKAVELILDDDIDGAVKGLADGTSAFHKLARGTLGFMKATMSFEQDSMKEASSQLYEAEQAANSSLHRAQNSPKVFNSNIYDKGAEFQLCQAESQVMSAIVGVLNESLTESLKGFFKLRRAYQTMDSLVQMEVNFMKVRGVQSLPTSATGSKESLASEKSTGGVNPRTAPTDSSQVKQPSALRNAEALSPMKDEPDDKDEFFEADAVPINADTLEGHSGKLEGHMDSDEALERELTKFNIPERPSASHMDQQADRLPRTVKSGMITEDADSEIFANSLDVFIHSGVMLMFGVLNLMISVIPPAFSKLLYIVGFRGDRDRGLQMLWQASKFKNVNGGMAGMIILEWYNGLVGTFSDIIPDTNPNDFEATEGYPIVRLEPLLRECRKKYPKSYLWMIEEARMSALDRDLERSLTLLEQPGRSKMKQLDALHTFEISLDSMYAHRYQQCADSFIACVDLNAWSQALYYYIAGAAHVSMYRDALDANDTELANQHKKMAKEYFHTAPSKIGKKKMMGRQLPFDRFVVRKLAKWEARAARLQCDLVDAIGVAPTEEMIYLWGGFKKMSTSMLNKSEKNLAWSENSKRWVEEDPDEVAALNLLRAVVLRNLRQHEKAKALLKDKLLGVDYRAMKGPNREEWIGPAAHYEMAVNCWQQRTGYTALHGETLATERVTAGEDRPKVDLKYDAKVVQEAKQYAEKVKAWEAYELDARFGLKVTSALDGIKWWERKYLTAR